MHQHLKCLLLLPDNLDFPVVAIDLPAAQESGKQCRCYQNPGFHTFALIPLQRSQKSLPTLLQARAGLCAAAALQQNACLLMAIWGSHENLASG